VSASGNFFDRFPRLRTTSTTDVRGERLEYRYRALIERNGELIRGKRVLDLGSHDGRWMLAALDAGARHVVGIEGRQQLIGQGPFDFSGLRGRRSSIRLFRYGLLFWVSLPHAESVRPPTRDHRPRAFDAPARLPRGAVRRARHIPRF